MLTSSFPKEWIGPPYLLMVSGELHPLVSFLTSANCVCFRALWLFLVTSYWCPCYSILGRWGFLCWIFHPSCTFWAFSCHLVWWHFQAHLLSYSLICGTICSFWFWNVSSNWCYQHPSLYKGLCAMCIHVYACVCSCVYMCVEARAWCQMSSSVVFRLICQYPLSLSPSTVTIDRMLCLLSFYVDARDQTLVLTLVWQTLYLLSHLPSPTNLFTSTILHQLKELTFSVQNPGLNLEQTTDSYLECSSIPMKRNKVQNTSYDSPEIITSTTGCWPLTPKLKQGPILAFVLW